jgi:hypothetical protein
MNEADLKALTESVQRDPWHSQSALPGRVGAAAPPRPVFRPCSEAARGRWREILPQLGVATKFLSGRNMPCPACGGRDRFRFHDRSKDGDYFCNQCGPGKGIGLVAKVNGWDFITAVRAVDKITGNNKPIMQPRLSGAPCSSPPLSELEPEPEPPYEPPKALADATLWLRRHETWKLKDWLSQQPLELREWINRERPWGYYEEEHDLESAQFGVPVDWGA